MTKKDKFEDTQKGRQVQSAEKDIVYVVQKESRQQVENEVGILDILDILWGGRKQVIAAVLSFAVASVIYALLATEWYRSESLLAPTADKSAMALDGQLGGLAALAGATVGSNGDVEEAIAVLESREFAREFIEESHLLPLLFPEDWDQKGRSWIDENPENWPDIRDGVEFFREKILHVRQERQTGLVILAIEWTDPKVAAIWCEDLIVRLNARLRDQALSDAEANVTYLQAELSKANVVALQASIGSLLEDELRKLMLARGNEEFAFRVIDKPDIPKLRVRPKRFLVVLLGILVGGTLGVFGVLVAHAVHAGRRSTV